MKIHKISIAAILILLVWPVCASGQDVDKFAWAPMNSSEMNDTTVGPHGGKINRRHNFILETLFDLDGIRVYVSDAEGNQLKPKGASGQCLLGRDSSGLITADFEIKRDPKNRAPRYRSTEYKRGYYLFAPHDFSKATDDLLRVSISISGLPGQTTQRIKYGLFFRLTPLRGWACRGHEHQIFLEYKDHPRCEKRYLDEIPFLYQCPKHDFLRSDEPSACPLCQTKLVPTRYDPNLPPPKKKPSKSRRKR